MVIIQLGKLVSPDIAKAMQGLTEQSKGIAVTAQQLRILVHKGLKATIPRKGRSTRRLSRRRSRR